VLLGPGSVSWLPDFGCAMLALEPADAQQALAQPLLGQLHLYLLGLDDWGFHLHR
jgi:hypothetical protein